MNIYIVMARNTSSSWTEAAFSSEKRAIMYLTQELKASPLQPDRAANRAYKRGKTVYRVVKRKVNAYHHDD